MTRYLDPNTGDTYPDHAAAFAAGIDTRLLVPMPGGRYPDAPKPPATVAAGTVDPNGASRIADDVAFLESNGWAASIPDTWFHPGTEMLPVGKRTFRTKAKLHADTPPVREGWAPAMTAIRAEDRKSYMVDTARLRMTDDGRIYTEGKSPAGAAPIEPEAFYALIGRFNSAKHGKRPTFPRSRALLEALDPDVRADVFNRQVQNLERFGYDEDARMVNLGHRVINGQRQIYRAVSTSYLDMPVNLILEEYLGFFEDYASRLPDARGVVDYDPATTLATWSATWHAPQTFDAKVGEIFELGIKGRSGDTGNAAHDSGLAMTRVICINCTVASWNADAINRRHRGSRNRSLSAIRALGLQRVRQDVARLTSGAGKAAEYFLDRWGVLRSTAAADVVNMESPVQAMTDAHKILSSLDAAAARDVTVEMLLKGYEFEGGDRVADVVNAVSRAASHGLLDAIQRDRAERAAGAFALAMAKRAEA